MYATIKTRAAFRTAWLREAVDYSVTPDALDNVGSTLRLQGGDIPRSAAGSFAVLTGTVFLISLVSPGKGVTDLRLSSPLELFTRPRPYVPPAAGASVGDFITRELIAGFRDEPDAAYAMPYLQIENTDQTTFVPPEADETGLYVLTDYLRTVRTSLGVEVEFSSQEDLLLCTIRKTVPGSHTLICGDGHTFLKANAYSRTAVAKVTTYQPVDTGVPDENGEKVFDTVRTDWYLASDGSVSSQEPQGRAAGEWETITVSEKNDAQEAAEAVFGKNTETHKVEFWTDARLHVRDEVRLRLPSGEVFSGNVTAVSRQKGDRRWLNQAGTLATTLTDKVRQASAASARSGGSTRRNSSAGEQIYAIGDVYVTTRAGDPAQLLGYGAWDRIRGRFLFAADDTRPCGTRFGAASHTINAEELPSDVSILDTTGVYIRTEGSSSGSSLALMSYDGTLRTKALGAGESFSLIPPGIALYVWVRKA